MLQLYLNRQVVVNGKIGTQPLHTGTRQNIVYNCEQGMSVHLINLKCTLLFAFSLLLRFNLNSKTNVVGTKYRQVSSLEIISSISVGLHMLDKAYNIQFQKSEVYLDHERSNPNKLEYIIPNNVFEQKKILKHKIRSVGFEVLCVLYYSLYSPEILQSK